MILPEPLMRTEDYVILDIADMIRREGSRMYGGAAVAGCAYQASLCGLTGSFARDGSIMALKGADIHVEITLALKPVDDSDGIERYATVKTDVAAAYAQGDVAALGAWHRHLCAYRRSMRTGFASAA